MNRIFDAVEKNRELILAAERYIWQNPETGSSSPRHSMLIVFFIASPFSKMHLLSIL